MSYRLKIICFVTLAIAILTFCLLISYFSVNKKYLYETTWKQTGGNRNEEFRGIIIFNSTASWCYIDDKNNLFSPKDSSKLGKIIRLTDLKMIIELPNGEWLYYMRI